MSKNYHIEVSDITKHQIRKNAELKRRVGSKAMARFISDRVDKLRELYSDLNPPLEKVCTYKDPDDGRRNHYGSFPANEDAINSPFDLPDFESQMPQITDYIED